MRVTTGLLVLIFVVIIFLIVLLLLPLWLLGIAALLVALLYPKLPMWVRIMLAIVGILFILLGLL